MFWVAKQYCEGRRIEMYALLYSARRQVLFYSDSLYLINLARVDWLSIVLLHVLQKEVWLEVLLERRT